MRIWARDVKVGDTFVLPDYVGTINEIETYRAFSKYTNVEVNCPIYVFRMSGYNIYRAGHETVSVIRRDK